MVNVFHMTESFDRMRKRHAVWKKKYPDSQEVHGAPFTGIENARPETRRWAQPPVDLKKLPFDPLDYMDYELPHQPIRE